MKLTDLNPNWVGAGGDGIFNKDPQTGELTPAPERHGCGVSFDCPCGCEDRCYVPFTIALDGLPWEAEKGWQRTGDTFETLTLRPSILRMDGCKWHGYITNGDVTTA